MKRPTVLVVVQSPAVADAILPALDRGANHVVVVDSFIRGKRQLALQPAVLITELRLGEYNGLHLALRAQAVGVPAIVVGDEDPVLQHDATQLGATYVASSEPVRERVEELLQRALSTRPAHDHLTWLAPSDPHPAPIWTTVLVKPVAHYH